MSRRDPLLALVTASLVILTASFVDRTAFQLAILAGAVLIASLAGLLALRQFWRACAMFVFVALTSSWIYAVAPDASHRATAGSGLAVGAMIFLRIMAVGLVSTVFALTTDLSNLARALVHRAGLPRRFVYGVLAAIQSGPALAEDWRMARLISRATETGIFRRIPRPGVILTLLAGMIRRASSAAIALEMRGVAAPQPTPWRVPAPELADWAMLGATIMGLVALVVFTTP